MTSPAELAAQHTLRTAVVRYDDLRARDSLADPTQADSVLAEQLSQAEALELLALSQVITRKAGYGQQLAVRSAREAGASWAAIGRALDISKQAAWEAHTRWIEEQAALHHATGYRGLDEVSVARAKRLAGPAES